MLGLALILSWRSNSRFGNRDCNRIILPFLVFINMGSGYATLLLSHRKMVYHTVERCFVVKLCLFITFLLSGVNKRCEPTADVPCSEESAPFLRQSQCSLLLTCPPLQVQLNSLSTELLLLFLQNCVASHTKVKGILILDCVF